MSSENTEYRGIATNRVLQDDDTFRVEVVKWQKPDGAHKLAVLKSMKDTTNERRRDSFQNENLGTAVFRTLSQDHPEWNLVVPHTYSATPTWSIRRFMKGEPILREGEEYTNVAQSYNRLARLATLLANIDQVPPDLSSEDDPRNSAPYYDIGARLQTWAHLPVTQGLLSEESLSRTVDFIHQYQPVIEPRYAHGDLMPYAHVFDRLDGRLAFIDFEHYSAYKPQYYDAAYCYAQMFVKPNNPHLAGYFLEKFLENSETPAQQTEKFLSVLAQRSIRLFFDAAYTNMLPHDPVVQRTQALLDLSLNGNLDSLLHPCYPKSHATIVSIDENPHIQSA